MCAELFTTVYGAHNVLGGTSVLLHNCPPAFCHVLSIVPLRGFGIPSSGPQEVCAGGSLNAVVGSQLGGGAQGRCSVVIGHLGPLRTRVSACGGPHGHADLGRGLG